MTAIILFFDGLCEPENPRGVACYSFVVYRETEAEDQKVFGDSGVAAEPSPDSTHDMAEYTGLIKGLEWIQASVNDRELRILGDSRLVVGQLLGNKVRPPPIVPLYERATVLLKGFNWTARWIPREENSAADALSLKAYREYCMKKYGQVPPTMRERGAIV